MFWVRALYWVNVGSDEKKEIKSLFCRLLYSSWPFWPDNQWKRPNDWRCLRRPRDSLRIWWLPCSSRERDDCQRIWHKCIQSPCMLLFGGSSNTSHRRFSSWFWRFWGYFDRWIIFKIARKNSTKWRVGSVLGSWVSSKCSFSVSKAVKKVWDQKLRQFSRFLIFPYDHLIPGS